MSFGLGISFGRWCKIQRLKKDIKDYTVPPCPVSNYDRLYGCGVYKENGLIINEDGSGILLKDGIETKLNADGVRKVMDEIFGGRKEDETWHVILK